MVIELVAIVLALALGAVGGAVGAARAVRGPRYKDRWRAALRLIETLHEENERLAAGQGNPFKRRANSRAAAKVLGRDYRSPNPDLVRLIAQRKRDRAG